MPITPSPGGPAPERARPAIVPRWECRWFGERSPVPEDRLRLPPGRRAVPTLETYFLSARTPHNVKLRRGVLEVKRLDEISDDGLERWSPVLSATFPLTPDELARVLAAWGVTAPADRRALTPAGFEALAAGLPDIQRVAFTKQRVRFAHGGCAGELVTLDVHGQRRVSLALEHADPVCLREAAAGLGLDPRSNLNYPAALKRLLAQTAPPVHAGEGVL